MTDVASYSNSKPGDVKGLEFWKPLTLPINLDKVNQPGKILGIHKVKLLFAGPRHGPWNGVTESPRDYWLCY